MYIVKEIKLGNAGIYEKYNLLRFYIKYSHTLAWMGLQHPPMDKIDNTLLKRQHSNEQCPWKGFKLIINYGGAN